MDDLRRDRSEDQSFEAAQCARVHDDFSAMPLPRNLDRLRRITHSDESLCVYMIFRHDGRSTFRSSLLYESDAARSWHELRTDSAGGAIARSICRYASVSQSLSALRGKRSARSEFADRSMGTRAVLVDGSVMNDSSDGDVEAHRFPWNEVARNYPYISGTRPDVSSGHDFRGSKVGNTLSGRCPDRCTPPNSDQLRNRASVVIG